MKNYNDNILELFLPPSIGLDAEKVKKWQILNTDLLLSANFDKNMLIIEGKKYYLRDFESIPLHFPENMWIDEPIFDQLSQLNEENCLTIETNGNNIINLRLTMSGIISAITAIIIGSLVVWAAKKGIIYSENAEYRFKDATKEKGYSSYKPDISYISFDDLPKDEQVKMIKKAAITLPPTVAVEIVSAKKGLKPALCKARKVWKKEGTKLTLVICPFSKMIYSFEKGVSGYRTQSIYETFTHQLLPGYEGDFSQYVDDIE